MDYLRLETDRNSYGGFQLRSLAVIIIAAIIIAIFVCSAPCELVRSFT
jgi:hypothetical protein